MGHSADWLGVSAVVVFFGRYECLSLSIDCNVLGLSLYIAGQVLQDHRVLEDASLVRGASIDITVVYALTDSVLTFSLIIRIARLNSQLCALPHILSTLRAF